MLIYWKRKQKLKIEQLKAFGHSLQQKKWKKKKKLEKKKRKYGRLIKDRIIIDVKTLLHQEENYYEPKSVIN